MGWEPGGRVRVKGLFNRGLTGVLTQEESRFGRDGWMIRVEAPCWQGKEIFMPSSELVEQPLALEEWLVPGHPVRITALTMRNVRGTLVRPTRLINGKAGWLVELDRRFLWLKRARIGRRALARDSE